MSKKVENVLQEIMSANMQEVLEIVEGLKKHFNISEDAIMATGGSNAGGASAAVAVEDDASVRFSVILSGTTTESIDQLKVLKAIKEINGMGYVEIKSNILEKVTKEKQSISVKDGLDKAEAARVSKILVDLGFKVDLKQVQ